MKAITVEVTKVIVVTVEAKTYAQACKDVETDMQNGEYESSWHRAEPQFQCLDVAEVP